MSNGTSKNKKPETEFDEKDLDRYKKRVNTVLAKSGAGKYYAIDTIDSQSFKIKFDRNLFESDMNLCGKYVICSNVHQETLDKYEIRQEYQNFQKIEHDFRDLKNENISIIPIYHRKEYQIQGHVQICFWAYTVIKTMEDKICPLLKELNEKECKQLSFSDVIAELKNIKLCEFKIGKGVSAIRYFKLNDLQQKIFDMFNLNPDDMMALMNRQ